MAVDFLRSTSKKVFKHVVAFAQQTVLHGPKYFMNHGKIEGGKGIKSENKNIVIKMSVFDRLVG